jgi:hypothetical protein
MILLSSFKDKAEYAGKRAIAVLLSARCVGRLEKKSKVRVRELASVYKKRPACIASYTVAAPTASVVLTEALISASEESWVLDELYKTRVGWRSSVTPLSGAF